MVQMQGQLRVEMATDSHWLIDWLIDKPNSRTTMGKVCLWKETAVWEIINMEVKIVAIDYAGARFLGTLERC